MGWFVIPYFSVDAQKHSSSNLCAVIPTRFYSGYFYFYNCLPSSIMHGAIPSLLQLMPESWIRPVQQSCTVRPAERAREPHPSPPHVPHPRGQHTPLFSTPMTPLLHMKAVCSGYRAPTEKKRSKPSIVMARFALCCLGGFVCDSSICLRN